MNKPLRYHEFIRFVFDRPAASGDSGKEWYFEDTATDFSAHDAEMVSLYRWLLTHLDEDLKGFSDEQVALGINYLFNNSCGNSVFSLRSSEVPVAEQVSTIRTMQFLYSDCFEKRCEPVLGHLSEPGGGCLNATCYMLWDVTPLNYWRANEDTEMEPVATAIFSVLKNGLRSKNDACVESVLHGLGHMKDRYPKRVETAIDKFLLGRRDIRVELRRYAEAARTGCIN